jgi:putative transposase
MIDTLSDERKLVTNQKLNLIKPLLVYDKAKRGDLYALNSFNELYKEFLQGNETFADLTQKVLLKRISEKSVKSGNKRISERQLQRYLKSYYDSENNRESFGVEGLISRKYLTAILGRTIKKFKFCTPKKRKLY